MTHRGKHIYCIITFFTYSFCQLQDYAVLVGVSKRQGEHSSRMRSAVVRPPEEMARGRHGFNLHVLTSSGACRRQELHRDCVKAYEEHEERRQQGTRSKLLLNDFSMVVATEDSASPTKIVTSDSKEVAIGQGHAAIWSGEYIHAGASYSVPNRRLFISITSMVEVEKIWST